MVLWCYTNSQLVLKLWDSILSTPGTKTVSTAVLEYNKGTNGLPVVFNMLDIRDGYYFALHATSSSRKQRMDASWHANETSKKKRLRRKLLKPGHAYEHATRARVLHEAGGFNG